MSDKKKQVRFYRYSGAQEGWWVAFMDELGFISIQSDWGDYSYRWSSRGEGVSMRQWISTTMANDRSYVLGKFAKGQREFDEGATRMAIGMAIEEASWKKRERALLKQNGLDDDEARREWYDTSDLENKAELMRDQPQQQLVMFMEKVWPHVCAAARKDLLEGQLS